MKPATLEQIYVEELRDLFDAEKQLLRALPRMAKAASHEELQMAFERHAKQTQEHANRLERILSKRAQNSRGKKCKAMMGLLEEGKEMMVEDPEPGIMDVGLITNAQKVEHYEIAGYGCMTTYAKLLGFKQDAALLEKTLQEEKDTDAKLTELAESIVNADAEEEGETEDEGDRQPRSKSQTQGRSSSRGKASKSSSNRSRGRSRSSSGSRHTSSDSSSDTADGEARATKDLEEIKAWAEARGGKPAHVKGTGSAKDPGLLRIDFPGYSGEQSLEHIPWEEWYDKFKENNLTFLHQDKKKDGHESRFFKLVCMEGEKAEK